VLGGLIIVLMIGAGGAGRDIDRLGMRGGFVEQSTLQSSPVFSDIDFAEQSESVQKSVELMHNISTPPIARLIDRPRILPQLAFHPITRSVMMEVTAYCGCPKCCGSKAKGLTASGKGISYNGGRFVAADKGLPFGTRLLVPGYNDGNPVEVIDRGGAIKGNKLDVFFPSHDQAKQWGRRRVMVQVLE
jgi:3D (Asp-Asp-Asp) domain-containing protein